MVVAVGQFPNAPVSPVTSATAIAGTVTNPLETTPDAVVLNATPSPRVSDDPAGITVPLMPANVTPPSACVAGLRNTFFSDAHASRNSSVAVNGTDCFETQSV